jgi:hypothetical protein
MSTINPFKPIRLKENDMGVDVYDSSYGKVTASCVGNVLSEDEKREIDSIMRNSILNVDETEDRTLENYSPTLGQVYQVWVDPTNGKFLNESRRGAILYPELEDSTEFAGFDNCGASDVDPIIVAESSRGFNEARKLAADFYMDLVTEGAS